MSPYLFVSYSRAQRAFAESIALTAIEYGLSVWFDLLCLMPGRNWQSDIRYGLENAAAVILLVSRESLTSANVADEVEIALAADRPLYLVLVEAVELRLQHAPQIDLAARAHSIVDMRGDFRSGFEKLITAFRTGAPSRDALPRPNRLLLPARLPRTVAETAISLLAPSLALVAILVYWLSGGWHWQADSSGPLARATTLNVVLLALSIPLQIAVVYLFLLRRLSLEPFINSLMVCTLWVTYCLFWQRRYLPGNPILAPLFAAPDWIGHAILAAIIGLACLATYRLFSSPDLLRWMPLTDGGYNPVRSRQVKRVNQLVLSLQKQAGQMVDPRPYFYALHYAPADEPIARIVRQSLKKHANITERSVFDAPAIPQAEAHASHMDLDLLLVTNHLATSQLADFMDSKSGYRILLLASPVRIPAGLEKTLSRLQWVEFRDMLAYQISFLLMYFRGSQSSRANYATNYVPARLDSLRGPLGLRQLVMVLRSFGTFSLASGVLAFAAPTLTSSVSPLMPWAILLGFWQFAMVHWLYQRSLKYGPFIVQLGVNLLLTLMIGVPELARRRFAVHGYFDVGIRGMADSWYLAFFVVLYLVASAFGLWRLRTRWFPVSTRVGSALPGPSQFAIARGHVPYIALALICAGYMAIND